MSIIGGGGISSSDVNAIINAVQSTYRKYGFSGTASTVASDTVVSASKINIAINRLNACINNSSNRRYYYYKGGQVAKMVAGSLLSASAINNINSVNTQVAKDYCSCDDDCCVSDCNCDPDCCYFDCSCDSDCCDGDGCDSDCCAYDCNSGGDDCSCDVDWCNNCCDSDCCDYNCYCDSD